MKLSFYQVQKELIPTKDIATNLHSLGILKTIDLLIKKIERNVIRLQSMQYQLGEIKNHYSSNRTIFCEILTKHI